MMVDIINGGYLSGKKTYVVSILGVLSAIAGYLTGEMGLADAIQVAITSGLGATLRHSIFKK